MFISINSYLVNVDNILYLKLENSAYEYSNMTAEHVNNAVNTYGNPIQGIIVFRDKTMVEVNHYTLVKLWSILEKR